MEMKVIDIEEENEITMYHLQEDKDSIIRNMVKRYTELEEKYDKTLIDYHNQMSDLQRLKDNSESHEEDKRRMINKI
jgi:allophanate hydrolase subunit 1